MGCFLACFGSDKDRKRSKRRHRVQLRDHLHASFPPVQSTEAENQETAEQPIDPVPLIREKQEEQLSFSSRKKVTFDTNVKTYEHIPLDKISESSPETIQDGNKEKEESIGNSNQHSNSSSENSSTAVVLPSCAQNHRYQNCRDSEDEDEEEEELEFGETDIDDDDGGLTDDEAEGQDSSGSGALETRMNALMVAEEFDSPMLDGLSMGMNRNTRDRSNYVHPVLNPVENLTQWKAAKKAKGALPLKPEKENVALDPEPARVSLSVEDSLLSFKSKSKLEQTKKPNRDVAVDASLSNWLVPSETTPDSTISVDNISPANSTSQASNSFTSLEDRPILGALTVEELKQMSASSSPRKSPSRHTPDEMPIIGTVGSYWTHTPSAKRSSSGPASSFKGIPNSTSKYREDRRVNYHSTPFETRLERALNLSGSIH